MQLRRLAAIKHILTDTVQITSAYLQPCREIRNGLAELKDFPKPLTKQQLEFMGASTQPDGLLESTSSIVFSETRNSWQRYEECSLWSVASSPGGDCLYNSLQLALFGTEAGSDALRLYVHQELVAEIHRYSFDACNEELHLTLFGTYGTELDVPAVGQLLEPITGRFRTLTMIAACSAVLRRSIAVHYPRNQTHNSNAYHSRVPMLTNPAHADLLKSLVIDIAWTSTAAQQAENFRPNFYVPILP